jgi:hypothetical protein
VTSARHINLNLTVSTTFGLVSFVMSRKKRSFEVMSIKKDKVEELEKTFCKAYFKK